jgi:hypothetical protein
MRQHWHEAQLQNPILAEFDIDPYYVLQIIALLEPGKDKSGNPKAPSIKRGAVLDMGEGQAKNQWDNAIEGLVQTLTILRNECGVLRPNLLPYVTMLVPFAAVIAKHRHEKGPKAGTNKIHLIRWFWCSVFGQQYENSANTQAERDFAALHVWLKGGAEPETVRNFQFNVNLRTITPNQRGVYRGVMALVLRNKPLDFFTLTPINAQMLDDKQNPVDDHHIFPQAFLNAQKANETLRDCILNRTYIDRKTNIRLSKTAPSLYFPEMRKQHKSPASGNLLQSHFLPVGATSSLTQDKFEDFLDEREQKLLAEIDSVTS